MLYKYLSTQKNNYYRICYTPITRSINYNSPEESMNLISNYSTRIIKKLQEYKENYQKITGKKYSN